MKNIAHLQQVFPHFCASRLIFNKELTYRLSNMFSSISVEHVTMDLSFRPTTQIILCQ